MEPVAERHLAGPAYRQQRGEPFGADDLVERSQGVGAVFPPERDDRRARVDVASAGPTSSVEDVADGLARPEWVMEIDVWAVIPDERMDKLPTPPARLEWRDAKNKAAAAKGGAGRGAGRKTAGRKAAKK